MPNEPGMYYPVPPIPPKPPQVTLLGSSISPPSNDVIENDDNVVAAKIQLKNANDQFAKADSLEDKQYATDNVEVAYQGVLDAVAMSQANLAKQLGLLPVELREELDLDQNEKWVRGFAYLPENGSAAINRAPGDVTTVDDPTQPPNLLKVEVQPWDVGVKMSASSLNGEEQIDYLGRVQRQSDSAAPGRIEYEFWTGELAQANGWPNNYLAGPRTQDVSPTPSAPAHVTADSAPTLPLTITLATNDTFILTSGYDVNSPDTFTIAPGVYTTIGELAAAVSAAESTVSPHLPFSKYVNVTVASTKLVFTDVIRGTSGNSDTITEGNGGGAAIGFSGNPDTFASGTQAVAVSMLEGLGIIQSYLSNTGFGGQGMIHLVPEAAPNLLNSRRVGTFLLDQFDNIIVPGVGYPGTGPSTEEPATGTSWIYGTDLVATRLQKNPTVFPKLLSQALDRGEGGNPNLITMRATRFAAAYFDGLRQFAVLVYLPGFP